MRRSSSLLLVVLAACGPMYGNPNGQGQQQQPQQVSGPPGGGGDPNLDPNTTNVPTTASGQSAQNDPQREPEPDPWVDPNRPDPRNDPRNDPRPEPRPDPRNDPRNEPPPEPRPEPRPEPARPEPARPEPRPQPKPGLSADAQTLVDAHNSARAKHCAGPLTWSPKLEQVAQQWANSLKDQGCKFGHSGGKYGENLAAGTSNTLDGNSVTAMWYDEVKDYDFKSGGFSMNTGHFTQVVWRQTTQIGCAKTTCRGMDIWVCEYDPPGNVDRGYRANVLPTSCK